jgi:hypothetical protein
MAKARTFSGQFMFTHIATISQESKIGMEKEGRTYNNHGIENLLRQKAVPRHRAADIEFIFGVLLGELGDLLGAECGSCLFDGQEERVLGEVGCHFGGCEAECMRRGFSRKGLGMMIEVGSWV